MKTLTSHHRERYGSWAGNPAGRKPNPEWCAESVYPKTGFPIPHQCTRKCGHGPEGAYCKQHAKRFGTKGGAA